MKAKKFLAVLLVLAICIPFTACGKSSGDVNKPATLTFWTCSLKPTFTNYINGLISTYEKNHTNVKIKWQDLPYDSYEDKLLASIAANESPDVVNLWTMSVLRFAGKGALADISKEATKTQKGVYISSIFKTNTLNGEVYAMPWYTTPNIALYNKDLFAKAGISAPPKTYDAMFADAKTMKEKTGKFLTIPQKVSEIFYFNDIPLLNSTRTKAAFNTTEAADLLQKYADGVKAGYIYKTDWNNWDKEIQLFSTGDLAEVNSGAQSVTRIKQEAPDVYSKLGIAEPVLGSSGKEGADVESLAIPSKSKYVKQSIDFASFITNTENELAFCKLTSIYPTTTKAAADPFFTSDTTTVEGQATALSAKVLSVSEDISLGIDKAEDVQTEIDNISQAICERGTPVKQALKNAETKVNQLLTQK